METLPRDILGLILLKLDPKDIVVLTFCISKKLKKHLCLSVNWNPLIEKFHWRCYTDHKNDHRCLIPEKYKAYQFYLLTKEDHEEQFGMPSYGVCDSPEQLARRFPEYKGTVYMEEMRREDQPARGGWRWREWGEYVGDLDPQPEHYVEYLYDADGEDGCPCIDSQWIFNRYSSNYGMYTKYIFECGEFEDMSRRVNI